MTNVFAAISADAVGHSSAQAAPARAGQGSRWTVVRARPEERGVPLHAHRWRGALSNNARMAAFFSLMMPTAQQLGLLGETVQQVNGFLAHTSSFFLVAFTQSHLSPFLSLVGIDL